MFARCTQFLADYERVLSTNCSRWLPLVFEPAPIQLISWFHFKSRIYFLNVSITSYSDSVHSSVTKVQKHYFGCLWSLSVPALTLISCAEGHPAICPRSKRSAFTFTWICILFSNQIRSEDVKRLWSQIKTHRKQSAVAAPPPQDWWGMLHL